MFSFEAVSKEDAPRVFVGFLKSHFVALVPMPSETPLVNVSRDAAGLYSGTVALNEGEAKFALLDGGQYVWGIPQSNDPALIALGKWSAYHGFVQGREQA